MSWIQLKKQDFTIWKSDFKSITDKRFNYSCSKIEIWKRRRSSRMSTSTSCNNSLKESSQSQERTLSHIWTKCSRLSFCSAIHAAGGQILSFIVADYFSAIEVAWLHMVMFRFSNWFVSRSSWGWMKVDICSQIFTFHDGSAFIHPLS